MKIFSEARGKILILLIIVPQLLLTYCSKTLYPDSSFLNIGSQAENKKLKEFLDGGTGKILNTRNTIPDEIIKTARQYLGVPHCMGGTTMKCIDCSGLLFAVFARNDIHLPHNSEEQARYGKIISGMDQLKKGDLVFFIRHAISLHIQVYISGIMNLSIPLPKPELQSLPCPIPGGTKSLYSVRESLINGS
jgi:lipoprotein Spr